MIRALFSVISILSFVSCGYYFSDTEKLTQMIDNSFVESGVYEDGDLIVFVEKYSEDYLSICLEENGEYVRGRAFAIPLKAGFLFVGSEIEILADENWNLVQGDLIFLIKEDVESLLVHDPIRAYTDYEGSIPFATECQLQNRSENTLNDYNMIPLCLRSNAAPQDIVDWFDANGVLGNPIASLKLQRNRNLKKDSRCINTMAT